MSFQEIYKIYVLMYSSFYFQWFDFFLHSLIILPIKLFDSPQFVKTGGLKLIICTLSRHIQIIKHWFSAHLQFDFLTFYTPQKSEVYIAWNGLVKRFKIRHIFYKQKKPKIAFSIFYLVHTLFFPL